MVTRAASLSATSGPARASESQKQTILDWLATAQDAQIWTALAVTGAEATSAQNGGSLRGLPPEVNHAL